MRIAIGAATFAAPGLTARPLLGASSRTAGAKMFTRLFGARDLVLGVGALQALRENRNPKAWVQLAALCDATDVVTMAAALGGKPRVPRLPALAALVSAATAAATGWRASSHIG